MPHSNKIIIAKLKSTKRVWEFLKKAIQKWFDYDKIDNAVLLRTRQEGDFIQINSQGSRKVKLYL